MLLSGGTIFKGEWLVAMSKVPATLSPSPGSGPYPHPHPHLTLTLPLTLPLTR